MFTVRSCTCKPSTLVAAIDSLPIHNHNHNHPLRYVALMRELLPPHAILAIAFDQGCLIRVDNCGSRNLALQFHS